MTVGVYEDNALDDDSDYKKRLERAEKEVKRITNKRRQGANSAAIRESDSAAMGAIRTKECNTQTRQVPPKPRDIGPCYRCAEWGHLVAACHKARTVYPFDSQYQPVVSKADMQLQGDMLPGTSKLTDVSASIDYKGKRSTEGSDCVNVLIRLKPVRSPLQVT